MQDDAWLTKAMASSVGDQAFALKYRVLDKSLTSLARLTQPVKTAVVLSLVSLVGSFIL